MSKTKKKMLVLDTILALVLIGFDQFTKHLAVVKLRGQEPFVLIKGVLELDYLENRGAAFGMLQEILCDAYSGIGDRSRRTWKYDRQDQTGLCC